MKAPPKFIGGAERARRRAQQRGWEPPSQKRRRLQREEEQKQKQQRRRKGNRHQQHQNNLNIVSLSTKKLRSSERFFAALLAAPNFPEWNAFVSSGCSHHHQQQHHNPAVLQTICSRLGLGPIPSRSQHPIHHNSNDTKRESFLPHTDNPRAFFSSRAILVMEEARHELEDALKKHLSLETDGRKRSNSGKKPPALSRKSSWTEMSLDSLELDQKRTGFLRLGFSKASGRFSPEEVFQQRPGSCFEVEVVGAMRQGTNTIKTTPKRVRMLCSVAPGKPGSFAKLVLVVYECAATEGLMLLLQEMQQQVDNSTENPQSSRAYGKVQWKIRFCVALISHCRQFEACDFGCASHHRKGNPLLKKIMGQKEATHIRFCYSDDEENGDGDGDGDGENDTGLEEGEEEIVGYITEDTDGDTDEEDYGGGGEDQNRNNTIHFHDNRDGKDNQERSKLHITMTSFTRLKALNPTQEMAAEKFCSSENTNATLELIQGPPGTGKTTFVVSVLARLLCQSRGNGGRKRKPPRRILVTAPTNKAVGVIAKRFLESCPGLLDQHGVPIAMIGVQDKLLEPNDDGTVDKGLKRIFCYTWLDTLGEEYEKLLEDLSLETIRSNSSNLRGNSEAATATIDTGNRGLFPWLSKAFPTSRNDTFMVGDDSNSDTEDEEERRNPSVIATHGIVGSASVTDTAKGLHIRLLRNLPRWSEASGAANLSRKLLGFLRDGDFSAACAYTKALLKILKEDSGDSSSSSFDSNAADDDEEEEDDDPGVRAVDAVPELLATARVIFCTLSTAGTSLMKQTRRIDDWIVDEAAAATEPELLIPLHLNPQRLLVVGDPRQLPASVSSPLSEQWGLGRSLHERLTVDLGRPQIMLDVQYRMRPEISEFPSHQFYGGKLINGENVKEANYGSSLSSCGRNSNNSANLVVATPPFCFFQVNGKEQQSHTGSYYNMEEAFALVSLLKAIRKRCHREREKSSSWCSSDKIRVITFYSAQVAILRQVLRKEGLPGVLVATVDSSQGCEADLVVLSFVRTTRAGFLRDDRRMNVALTRARHKLVCLANVTKSTWALGRCAASSSDTLTNLLYQARTRDCICSDSLSGACREDEREVGRQRSRERMGRESKCDFIM